MPQTTEHTVQVPLKSRFLAELRGRGFIEDCSDIAQLDEQLACASVTGYIGFDCTASSLHVGHLLSIMMLRWMQKMGHRPIVLLGGGTTRIGDPSGRDKTRAILTDAQIAENMNSIRSVFDVYLETDGSKPVEFVDNAAWLDNLKYIDFLREYGQHFSVNRMISFESVKSRLDRQQSLSFLEFNYMITQAYDFLELNRRFGATLQMGGSDQWGNIINGIELARRTDSVQLYALTTPLLTTSDGKKMGKTANGAVWLNADLTSSYDFWQFWRNCTDADVGKFLRIFTELPLEQIAELEATDGAELNQAKIILATEATALLHGRAAAEHAAETANATFADKGAAGKGLPKVKVSSDGVGILTLCVEAGFASSNGQARRILSEGGVRLDGAAVSDPRMIINADKFDLLNGVKLSFGKKKHALLVSDNIENHPI